LWQHEHSAEFVVFDNGVGERAMDFNVGDGTNLALTLCGARAGHKYYRSENLATMALAARFGAMGSYLNQGVRLIDSSDAVLDVSGGDSFSDIYGRKRFFSIVRPKQIAIRRGVPLILLPQTYGPYNDPGLREIAIEAVRGADMAWARDEPSFAILKDMLGDVFDAERHFSGVDLAFGLQPLEARAAIDHRLLSWIDREGGDDTLIGFNINGLIYNSPQNTVSQYGFKADYRRTLVDFLTWVLERGDTRVVLIPHVMSEHGHYESDHGASTALVQGLPGKFKDRITVSPNDLDQSQVKWLISKMDWFCGPRMHSTIAALSSGVATASIVYSDKAKGVFETCGQSDYAVDPRELDTDEVVSELMNMYEMRRAALASLMEHLPTVKAQVNEQMQRIATRVIASGR
jgi:polysaccharide pyruvyl transferase WcaK-like protein